MKRTFSEGISDDSLYYLWAEIFLYRGVLDTALALNYSIPVSGESVLENKVLEQRYTIYSTLGWEKKAEAVLDSLGRKPSGRLRRLLPECTVFLSGGAYYENNAVDKNYPYPRSSDSTEGLVNGNGIFSLRVGWNKKTGSKQGIRFGGKLRFAGSRFSAKQSTAHLDDSADASIGTYVHYSMLSNRLRIGYTVNRKKDFLGTQTYLHQSFIRYAFLLEKWIGSIETGYNYEAPINEHFYYVMSYLDRILDKKNSISFTLFCSGMDATELAVPNFLQYLYVKDNRIYTDSTFTTMVNNNNNFIRNTPVDSVFDWLPVSMNIPQSFFSINPHTRYTYQMNKYYSFGAGIGYTFTWYKEKYSWADLTYDNFKTANFVDQSGNNVYAAFNQNDSSYYWIGNIPFITGQTSLLSSPISFHRQNKRRVDQSIAVNLFLKREFGIFGDVMLDITARRNFSSLMESAPVAIQRWYGEMMLTWFFRFKPDKGP